MANDKARILITAEDKTREAFTSVQRNLDGLKGVAGSLAGVLGGLGAGLSLAGLAASIKSAVDQADNMGKLAQKTGVAVEELSKLDYAAKLSDVSQEQLAAGLQKLSRNMVEAADGTGAAADAFAALKLDPAQFSSADQALKAISDKFATLPDGANKTALAMQLFGKAGAELIPLLNSGSEGLKKMGDEAERFGIVINSKTAQAAEQFNDNMTRLSELSRSVGISLGNTFLPAMNQVGEAMLETARSSGVLAAAVIGIGEAFKIAFYDAGSTKGGAIQQQQKFVKELENELNNLKIQAAYFEKNGGKGDGGLLGAWLNGGSPEKVRQQIATIKLTIDDARLTLYDLENKALPNGKTAGATVGEAAASAATKAAKDPRIAEAQRVFESTRTESEKLAAEMARLDALLGKGYISWDTYSRAVFDATAKLDDAKAKAGEVLEFFDDLSYVTADPKTAAFIKKQFDDVKDLQKGIGDDAVKAQEDAQKKIQDEMKKTNDVARDLGLTFASAFEDAIIGGKGFSDVLRSLAEDILKLAIRKNLTEPLLEAAQAAFDFSSAGGGFGGGSGGVGSILGSIGSLFGGGGVSDFSSSSAGFFDIFKDGGIMTAQGKVPLNKYAGGGVANSAQLAVFGEGSTPEAYVPLPDGRSIPVTMDGAGGGVTVVNNYTIDARGAAAGVGEEVRRAIKESENNAVSRSIAQVKDLNQRGQLRFA